MLIIKLYNKKAFITIKIIEKGATLFKNIKTIKEFYGHAKIKKSHIVCMFIFLIIPALLSIVSPILISNLITAITVYDYSRAITQSILEFLILIISTISYYFYYLINRKTTEEIIFNYHTFIYENVRQNKNINNISLATLKDISTCVSFNKNLIFKICFFIKSIIILAIIFFYDIYICITLIIVSIISYILLSKTDSKIKYYNQELSIYEQKSVNLFNSICKGEDIESNYNIETALKDKYFEYVKSNTKLTNKISFFYNINNNFITLILKTAIFVSGLYLILLVKSTTLTLSIFLILTPYLTSSAENLIAFFDIFSEIALVDNVLSNFKSLKFTSEEKEKTPIEISSYNIYFYNISLNINEKSKKDISLKINHKETVLFIDEETIYNNQIISILNRQIKPLSGSVFIDGKNISDIPLETYKRIITFVSFSDEFFDISIFENLYIVCQNRKLIFKTLKDFGLMEQINTLPEKINTVVSSSITQELKFLLSLSRAYLSGAKIICIYNLSMHITKQLKNLLLKIINLINKNCTIIIFNSHNNLGLHFNKITTINKENISTKIMNNLSNNADNNIRK